MASYTELSFMSSAESQALRERFDKAQAEGKTEELSNRHRLMFDDEKLAQKLYQRWSNKTFMKLTDEYGDEWDQEGLNIRFRLVKYDPGQGFDTHEDGTTKLDWNVETMATFMIYLNDVPREACGATVFDHLTLQPKEGLLVVFPVAHQYHKGETVKITKYFLRTDVVYRGDPSKLRAPMERKAYFQAFKLAQTLQDETYWNQASEKEIELRRAMRVSLSQSLTMK